MKKKIEDIRKENGLIFRPDITEIVQNHIQSINPLYKYTKKELGQYQVFEKETFLFYPEYDPDKRNKINCFGSLGNILWGDWSLILCKEIMDKFHVNIGKNDYLICNCGLDNRFSAYVGGYELILVCECGNEFCAYSG